jgi:hypothetical protein
LEYKRLSTILMLSGFLAAQKPPAAANWVLTFSDEFDGKDLNLARWSPHAPFSHVPGVLDLSGGQLHLKAGVVSTYGVFAQTYGRFEIRCRIPAGRGLRAAFQLMPVPQGDLPRIEVFQSTGNAPSKISFANRWGTEQTERSFFDSFAVPDLSVGLHTIAVEWERDHIMWTVDGKEKFQSADGVPHQQMYLQLDLTAKDAVPASFDIDYVRVYQHPGER